MSRSSRRRLNAQINVVPYIDVMLVLLIIFMVTAPLITTGVDVTPPTAAANPLSNSDDEPLVLSVDTQGNLYLDVGQHTDQPLSPQDVVLKARAVLIRKPDTPVLVKGAGDATYEQVVRAMVLLQQAGANKVGLVTQPPAHGSS